MRQSIWPQHSLLVVQAAAASRQHAGVVGSARHESPVQHCEAPMGQGDPAAVHIAVTQVPAWQARPVQQSPLAAQRDPLGWQAQRPVRQSISPQHSALFAQVPPASSQHDAVVGLARHERPVQHWAAVVHVAAAAVHMPATGPQVPMVQARPAEHWAPVVQQGWPDAPQVTATQADPVQL